MLKIFKKPENLFLIICLLWGFLLAFINPPFQSFDEFEHFYKIYGFTEGTLNYKKITSYTDGTLIFKEPKTFSAQILPVSIVRIVVESKRLNPYFDEKRVVYKPSKITPQKIFEQSNYTLDKNFKTLVVHMIPSYTVISYVPHTIVLALLKAFDTPPLFMMYMLRLCSLFLYTGLIYTAIKITPVKKDLFLLVSIAPLPLYLSSTINTDHFVIGLSFLLTAYVLKLGDKKYIGKKQLSVFIVLMLLICICKFTYLPLVLLYFVIPKENYESQKTWKSAFWLMLVLCLTWIIGFILYTTHIFIGIFSYYNKNVADSILFILQHPADYLVCLVKTIAANSVEYSQRILSDFGCSDTNVNPSFIYGYFILLISNALFCDKQEKPFSQKTKIIFAAIFLSVLVLTLTANYIIFAFDSNNLITGFKGRYLLPVLPLILMMFDNKRLKLLKINLPLITVCYSVLFMIVFAATLVQRYYIFRV